MTWDEFTRNILAPYGPTMRRAARVIEGQPARESAVVFEHYESGGIEFVVLSFDRGEVRIFAPTDIETLKTQLEPPTNPTRRR